MRHGTTVWNEKGITQGRSNNRLSKNGVEKTKQVAKKYANVKFDFIVCSPLFRAVQTANLMNTYHNVKIKKDMNLIEIEQGIFTGRHKDSLTPEEKILKYRKDKSCGMESYQEVYDRSKVFVESLKKYDTCNNILVVTHACNATMLENIFKNRKIDLNNRESLKNFDNAEIKKFVL